MKLFIVYQQWPQTMKIEELAAFFDETAAREYAVKQLGAEPVIGLRTIEVLDEPKKETFGV